VLWFNMVFPLIKMFLISIVTLLGGGYMLSHYAPPLSEQLSEYIVVVCRFFYIWIEVFMFVPVAAYTISEKGPKFLRRFILGLSVLFSVWITLFHLTFLLMTSLLVAWFCFCFTESHTQTEAYFRGGDMPAPPPLGGGNKSTVFSNLYEKARRVPGSFYPPSIITSKGKGRAGSDNSGSLYGSPHVTPRNLVANLADEPASTEFYSATSAPAKVSITSEKGIELPNVPTGLPGVSSSSSKPLGEFRRRGEKPGPSGSKPGQD